MTTQHNALRTPVRIVEEMTGHNVCLVDAAGELVAYALYGDMGRLSKTREQVLAEMTCIVAACNAAQEAADTIERLTAERDAARANAERYRWLRDKAADSDCIIFSYCDGVRRFMLGGVHADEYVDAAIRASEGQA